MMGALPLLAVALAAAVLLVAALSDLRRFEIPDSCSVLLLLLAGCHGLSQPQFVWWQHVASALLVFALGALLFARGWMGGGDVKLLAAVAAWASLATLPLLIGSILLAGGLLALVMIIARRLAARPATQPTLRLLHMDAPLPYGVAILAGSIVWALRLPLV